jgi:hypothetical protein
LRTGPDAQPGPRQPACDGAGGRKASPADARSRYW